MQGSIARILYCSHLILFLVDSRIPLNCFQFFYIILGRLWDFHFHFHFLFIHILMDFFSVMHWNQVGHLFFFLKTCCIIPQLLPTSVLVFRVFHNPMLFYSFHKPLPFARSSSCIITSFTFISVDHSSCLHSCVTFIITWLLSSPLISIFLPILLS